MRRCLENTFPAVLAAAILAGGCTDTGGPPAAGTASFAVTCDPVLEVYPVHGPHNGGYDSNWDNFTCPPHPDSSPDNSDFIAGDHYGNDIFAERGTPVVAARAGDVVSSGWDSVGGWSITVVDECGWWTYYCHFDEASPVPEGVTVSAGDVIGSLGNSGNASGTAPHLHFSIFPDGDYASGINPFELLETVDDTACEEPCECDEGDTESRACLDCGTQTRTCGSDCAWGDWTACDGPDPDGGTRACDTGLPGPCAEGRVRCIDGSEVCVGLVEPSEEACAGVPDGEAAAESDAVPEPVPEGPPDTADAQEGGEGERGTAIEGGCGCSLTG